MLHTDQVWVQPTNTTCKTVAAFPKHWRLELLKDIQDSPRKPQTTLPLRHFAKSRIHRSMSGTQPYHSPIQTPHPNFISSPTIFSCLNGTFRCQVVLKHVHLLPFTAVTHGGYSSVLHQLFQACSAHVVVGTFCFWQGCNEGHWDTWQKFQELHQFQIGTMIGIGETTDTIITHEAMIIIFKSLDINFFFVLESRK